MRSADCLPGDIERRRVFWTTLESCGRYNLCGQECIIPGLEYINKPEGRTISNVEWLRGLVLNILNTRARSDLMCPTPAGTYGHWSESYRDDGLYIGTRMFNAAEKSYPRVLDGVKAIGAAIRSDVSKLVILNLATGIDVDVTYRGRSRVDVEITITSRSVRQTLNLSGSYSSDVWMWN